MSPPFIWLDRGALAPEICRAVIARFERDPRKRAGATVGRGGHKRSTDLGVSRLPGWEDLAAALARATIASATRYRDAHPTFRRVHRRVQVTGWQIQRYQPGGDERFDWHADVVDAATARRVLALVLYLNTVPAGGATEFRDHALAVAPEEGAALWFPPTFDYLHRGLAPRDGPKYVATSFLLEGDDRAAGHP